MPDPQAAPVQVSPLQLDILQQMVRRTTSAQRLVKRSRIILLAATGIPNTQIAKQVQVDHETVRRWRERWRAAESRLQAIEATGKQKLLSQAIEVLLTDEQRPGAPATFTFEQFMQIMAVACETPAAADRLSCTSVQELRTRILAFIAYYNRTSNGAFHWTYKGPPARS